MILKIQNYNYLIKSLINTINYLNTKMYKIKLGADIGKVVDLNPIYFDLGTEKVIAKRRNLIPARIGKYFISII